MKNKIIGTTVLALLAIIGVTVYEGPQLGAAPAQNVLSFVDNKIAQISDEQATYYLSTGKYEQVLPTTFRVQGTDGTYWVDEEVHPDGTVSWKVVVEIYTTETYRKFIRYGKNATTSQWFIPKQPELY
jgi:hypothetical protein